MTQKRHEFPHIAARTEAVKAIWIQEYERKRRTRWVSVIPTALAYSMGYWAGAKYLLWTNWAFTLTVSLVIFLVIKIFTK